MISVIRTSLDILSRFVRNPAGFSLCPCRIATVFLVAFGVSFHRASFLSRLSHCTKIANKLPEKFYEHVIALKEFIKNFLFGICGVFVFLAA